MELGQGYAIRSVSHAGHGLMKENGDCKSAMEVEDYCCFRGNNDRTSGVSPLIPWTVEGQVVHKIAYVDSLLSSIAEEQRNDQLHNNLHQKDQHQGSSGFLPDLKFIFIGHSFGCHVIQRMCVLRPDILERVSGFLFLMPYIRTKPSFVIDQRKLEFGGSRPELLIGIGTKFSQSLRSFPESMVRSMIRRANGGGDDESITNIITKILRNPSYPRNFFELGTEEIRDIPNEVDIASLRLLSSYRPSLSNDTDDYDWQLARPQKQQRRRPIFILYAGDNDQWCPSFHGDEIKAFQSANVLPSSIKTTKIPNLRHDYVCQDRPQREKVNDWIVSNILEMKISITPRSNAGDSSEIHTTRSVNQGFDRGSRRPATSMLLASKL